MSGAESSRATALLPSGYRASGLLLHITSLPSEFGIGDLGPDAFAWVDRLSDAGQSWWQILPLGPTGLGYSPYDPLSTFAGSVLMISPRKLLDDGLVSASELESLDFPADRVDFDSVRRFKLHLIGSAWSRFQEQRRAELHSDFDQFRAEQAHWLDDFALFMAIKEKMQGAYFYNWPSELARRDPQTLARVVAESAERMDFVKFGQFLFFRQWQQLRAHAHARGVQLMGDLPFFVAHDSSEVWAHPELFLLDKDRHPTVVAGVPPDYFSKTGQRWGNPVYNWTALKSTNYRWWMRRLSALLRVVDGVRLDHFRAFSAAWHIPAASPTAEAGQWIDGPGEDFFVTAREALGGLQFIAEDLGLITDDVRELRDAFGLPGMCVMQFGFDGDPDNLFLPHNYVENSVAFTGTHDNNTTRGWFETLDEVGMESVVEFFGPDISEFNIASRMIDSVWKSRSALAIAPLQDLLGLDGKSRMNIPGQAAGNWSWRVRRDQVTHAHIERLAKVTADSGRWRSGR